MKRVLMPLVIAGALSSNALSGQDSIPLYPMSDMDRIELSTPASERRVMEIFHDIGQDTVFNNAFYIMRLGNEIRLWKTIFSTDSTKSVVYNSQTFQITDTIESRFAGDYLAQRKLDKEIVDSIHVALTGKHMPARRVDRIYSFRFGRKNFLEQSLKRMLPFMEKYASRLSEEGLPLSTLMMPIYESGFQPFVKSWAGATGQFQFLSGTGKDFGLEYTIHKNSKGDYHFELKRSYIDGFEAFISYLKKAEERFRDHPSFIPTSFNIGLYSNKFKVNSKEEEVKALKKMGFAPRSYFSELVALIQIMDEFPKHFPDFDYSHPQIDFSEVEKTIAPSDIEKTYRISENDFYKWNPQYIKGANTYMIKKGRRIVLPADADTYQKGTVSKTKTFKYNSARQ